MREAAKGRVVPRPGGLLVMLGHALAVWAGSAGVLALGLTWASEPVALAVHALVAPIWAGLVAWLWFARFGRRGPVDSAVVFAGAALVVDLAIFAFSARAGQVLIENLAGAGLPLIGIALVVFAVGTVVNVSHTVQATAVLAAIPVEVFDAALDPELHVTSATRPKELGYHLAEPAAPIVAQEGHLVLERVDGVDGGTAVTWTSTLRVRAFPFDGIVGRRTAAREAEALAARVDALSEVIEAHRRARAEPRTARVA